MRPTTPPSSPLRRLLVTEVGGYAIAVDCEHVEAVLRESDIEELRRVDLAAWLGASPPDGEGRYALRVGTTAVIGGDGWQLVEAERDSLQAPPELLSEHLAALGVSAFFAQQGRVAMLVEVTELCEPRNERGA